jgi:uncharacterized SAM-binding protein YcdF (DUF218 family)
VASLGWFIFSVGGAVAALVVTAIWVAMSRGHVASRLALGLLAACYWFASAGGVASALTQTMAAGYGPLTRDDVPAGKTAVVLLGSGAYRFRDWSNTEMTGVDFVGSSRLLEAARVYHLLNAAYVVSSGGLLEARDRNVPSGSAMADALQRMGVPAARIRIENESGTTRDEAVRVGHMLMAEPVDHVVLVTSAVHMRRSLGAFRAEHVEAIPAIAREPQMRDAWWQLVAPTQSGMDETSMAAHELAGILVYRMRGWYR